MQLSALALTLALFLGSASAWAPLRMHQPRVAVRTMAGFDMEVCVLPLARSHPMCDGAWLGENSSRQICAFPRAPAPPKPIEPP